MKSNLHSYRNIFLVTGSLMLVLCLVIPLQHDYYLYVDQWGKIMNGQDPYINTGNAYGVVYNFFALFVPLLETIPRAIFILIYLVAGFKLIQLSFNTSNRTNVLCFIVLFNPLLWIFGVKFGVNDTFLAGITLMSITSIIRNKRILAGVMFATGASFKFSSVFVLPFFVFKHKRIDFRLLISFCCAFTLIYGVGYLLWGNSILEPFLFGANRESKILSVFRFIRGEVQPLAFLGVNNLDYLSTYLMLVSYALSLLVFWWLKLDKYLMSLFAYSNVLLFYKVGHPQFYFLFIFLAMLAFLKNEETIRNDILLKRAAIVFGSWISFCVVLYDFTGNMLGTQLFWREYLGAPTFILQITFNVLLLRHALKKENILKVAEMQT